MSALKHDIKRAQIKRKLQDALNALPDHRGRKNEISMLEYACNVIENSVAKGSPIDKLELLYEVLDLVFDKLTESEKINVKKNVLYLLASGAIKRDKFRKRVWKFVKSFLEEK